MPLPHEQLLRELGGLARVWASEGVWAGRWARAPRARPSVGDELQGEVRCAMGECPASLLSVFKKVQEVEVPKGTCGGSPTRCASTGGLQEK